MAEEKAKIRVVRCPKCDKLLPELANFTVYRCGGCNATLQAKRQNPASEKTDGETVKYFENAEVCSEKKGIVVSDASSEVDPKGERVEFIVEEKEVYLKELPSFVSTSVAKCKNEDDIKEREISKLGESLIQSRTKGIGGKSRLPSEAPAEVPNANLDDLGKVEKQETKIHVDYANGHHRCQQRQSLRNGDRDCQSAYQCSYPYSDEGPSNYHHNPANRKNLDGPCSPEHLDQDRADLLRKLDELREQLRRSCEVAEKPKERPAASRTSQFSNPYIRNNRNNWFPEGLSSLNWASSRNSPFMNGHSMDIPNLNPTVHPQNGIPGYREAFGPNSLGRYPRLMSNCLYGQFEPDPLVSYHHDGFYHQPACSCLHCCNAHWPSLYSNQRVPYPVNNHGFYQADGPPVLENKNYNQRGTNGPFNSNEPLFHQRPMFVKKDGRACRPIAGAAPFVSCYNCFELLQLPEDVLGAGKRGHKFRCGSCSHLMSFECDGTRIIPSASTQTTNVTSEKNHDSNDGTNGHTNRHHPSYSYSGSFNSTGYEVHSADEKLVLPSYPPSVNEAMEKECGFQVCESEKMQGLSSSPSTFEDVDSVNGMICQRDVPSSTELPLETEGISRVPSLPLHEHSGCQLSDQVVNGSGNGSRSMCSDQEKIVSMNGNFKQNSVKDVPVASEMDLSENEYSDAGLSLDSWDVNKYAEEQLRAKNNKNGQSFFTGFIKKGFREFSRFNQSMENGRCKVSINGHPIADRLVKKAEKLAGPIHPGDYWYDYRAGFWGVIGHACLGIIPPFIEEFNYPMPNNCAGGNTGVFVNGRELHHNDLTLLVGRGLPATEGQSYIIEISGKVWDEVTGDELDCLGKLAPTIEKVKHGFGMHVPRVAA